MTADLPGSFRSKFLWGASDLTCNDIRLAATTRAGVMITGPLERAEAVAREIHRYSHQFPPRIVDGADEAALGWVLSNEGHAGPLLVQNVDRLSKLSQSRLLAWTDLGHRVICWGERVADHKLMPELFYRLNIVRIDLCNEN
jgi:hypothetical protein